MRNNKKKEEKILDVDASMQGNMIFRDPVNLRINGTFEGALITKGNLTIGENATVKADIKGEFITVAGNVIGDIEASRNLKIVPPAKVVGNVKTPVFSIAEGSVFEGKCHMLRGKDDKALSNKNVLTVDEVARYLEVDTSLILTWAREGKLPGSKDKDTWKFERATLDSWIANEKIK
ncbi:MAG: polymer-forming cytoskeletal protein [Candidatus Omnitrophica bacterium]|nr:polymer-forming cytoskeletal protein [Candidatus Omnitrophota bacterium]